MQKDLCVCKSVGVHRNFREKLELHLSYKNDGAGPGVEFNPMCHTALPCLGADQRDSSWERDTGAGQQMNWERVCNRRPRPGSRVVDGISECVSSSAPVPSHLAPAWPGPERLQPEAAWKEVANTSEKQAEARRSE